MEFVASQSRSICANWETSPLIPRYKVGSRRVVYIRSTIPPIRSNSLQTSIPCSSSRHLVGLNDIGDEFDIGWRNVGKGVCLDLIVIVIVSGT